MTYLRVFIAIVLGATYSTCCQAAVTFSLNPSAVNVAQGASATFDLVMNIDASCPTGMYMFQGSSLTLPGLPTGVTLTAPAIGTFNHTAGSTTPVTYSSFSLAAAAGQPTGNFTITGPTMPWINLTNFTSGTAIGSNASVVVNASAVPEPSSLGLLSLGVCIACFRRRRRE